MGIEHYIGLLAHATGIEYNAGMKQKVDLLKAMGILEKNFDLYTTDPEQQGKNYETVKNLFEEKEREEFINIVHHVPVLRKNRVKHMTVSLPEGVKKLRWNFYEDENPKKYYKGEVKIKTAEEADASDADKHYFGEVFVEDMEALRNDKGEQIGKKVGDTQYLKYSFKFPFEVKLGYHNIEFEYEDKNGNIVHQKTHMISAPEKCYDGLGIAEGKKTWGVPVQLYEQVSENNLGIGNFSDLAHLGYILGKNGAGIMGVNPLHASRDDQPENASPYGPDSRMFFNYLYVDVTAVDEFKNSPEIQEYYYSKEFQDKVKRNRRRTYVDYTVTQGLVDDILHRCFEKFDEDHTSEDHNRYEVFCDENDGVLEMYATFRALNKFFSSQNPKPADWRDWPEEYKNPKSDTIKRFKETHRDEIEYYKYTQWLCEKQLSDVKENCINSGMKIGLYMDMAVGASRKGFEAWYYSDLYMKGSAGAEPDILSQQGQRWGLLAFNPFKLQEEGYEPYRQILETNMRHAGCLRIDHVLQLNRIYMFPDGEDTGSYIYYNSEELMAMLALESHRNKTMIIGEDLGNTSEHFRRVMEDFGIMSYKVLPFERKNDVWNSMVRPEEYPQMSVCAPSTHDTPTLINQWNVQHIYQQKFLDIITKSQAEEKFIQYASQRQALNWVLGEYHCWEEVGGKPSLNPEHDANTPPEKYVQAVTSYLGQSRSAVMMMPFSDIFGLSEMGNIPGTTEMEWSLEKPLLEIKGDKSYPNWRKKSHFPIEHIEEVDAFKETVGILNKYRPDGNDGRGRYYQFERPGTNHESTIDFDHYKRMFNIIKNRENYQFSKMLESRYSEAYKRRLDNRREHTQERYAQEREAWVNQRDDFEAKLLMQAKNENIRQETNQVANGDLMADWKANGRDFGADEATKSGEKTNLAMLSRFKKER